MPGWLITLISIAGSALISGVIGYLVKRSLDKYFQKRDAKEQEFKRQALELEALKEKEEKELLDKTIRDAIKQETEPLARKLDAVANGTLSGLRNSILTCYYKCLEKGYRNDWDYQNVHHLNDSYLDLNGNSYVADVMRRFDELPTKEEYLKSKKKKTTSTKNAKPKKKILVESN